MLSLNMQWCVDTENLSSMKYPENPSMPVNLAEIGETKNKENFFRRIFLSWDEAGYFRNVF